LRRPCSEKCCTAMASAATKAPNSSTFLTDLASMKGCL
jgi:hypothetical protein